MNDTIVNVLCSVLIGLNYKYLYNAVLFIVDIFRGN